jgi:serine/threonine protein kinase
MEGLYESKQHIYIVMEMLKGGELFERVIDENFTLTERLCELYLMQICDGINFMHNSNILHLDMKVQNLKFYPLILKIYSILVLVFSINFIY